MENSIFSFTSYKQIMAERLTGEGQRGQLTKAAESIGCQRSYLSRVISEKLQLTQDHAFQLANFLKLNAEERLYFQTLVEYERSTNPQYRTHLKSQLAELKRKHESIQERTKRSHLSPDLMQTRYFSSWIWTAIHFLTSIPEYQNAEALAIRLGLSSTQVLDCLKHLESNGMVQSTDGQWKYQGGEFHLPKESPLVQFHHQNWRQRALLDSQDSESSNVHFTAVFAVSKNDFEKLKEMMLTFISEANRVASPSKPEEAIAITCDLFRA